ncbi:MAG TPA: regulatory iron-sulfur-containing complex subunit RicT, partial [bacterium]|nr:regulatory iron-sulfur-containing complex subunit RicT [bacterium]
GRPLCCSTFLTELSSITSDVADIQGVSHRGSERISGVCGRLMCCLAYEAEGYKELAQKLPEVGSPWKIEGESGTVISRNILKGTIIVELSDKQSGGSIVIEVDPLKLAENTPSLAHRRWKKHQAN